jgi:lysophospholipid acyltransferase (LPLAT)-like uncharacterized protein
LLHGNVRAIFNALKAAVVKTGNRWKELKFALLLKLTKPVYYILFLYTKTLRFQVENEQGVFDHMHTRGPVILAGWHQRFFCGFFLPQIYKLVVPIMISRSRDGDFIAGVVQNSGFLPVRGSSSRGGKEALREMVDKIKECGIGAHILDGPTGPPRVVKAGLLAMAQRAGAVICPVYIVCEKCWIFNSWDRFMVPKPFSRVLISFSKTMEGASAYLDGPDFEAFRTKIEDQMIRTYEKMDRYSEENR